MDMQLGGNRRREKSYRGVQGTIVSIEPTRIGNRRADGCLMFVGLENQDGDLVNFMVSPTTFVLDFFMLREGMEVTMYYRTDEPVPLIYPPQYRAAVATNNQRFMGNPANNDLVVVYSSSTRSIPAQTTPSKIVVLCPISV